MGLSFQAKDDQEFKEFDNYLKQSQEEVRLQNMTNEAKKILNIMQNDITKFRSILCITSSINLDVSEEKYYDYPIFKHLSPKDFMETLLMLSPENISYIFSSLKERYSVTGIVEKLIDELDFLKEFQKLLIAETLQRQGKLSGYLLSVSNNYYLKETINVLEEIKKSQQQNNI